MKKRITTKVLDETIKLLQECDMRGDRCPDCGAPRVDVALLCGHHTGANCLFVCRKCGEAMTNQEGKLMFKKPETPAGDTPRGGLARHYLDFCKGHGVAMVIVRDRVNDVFLAVAEEAMGLRSLFGITRVSVSHFRKEISFFFESADEPAPGKIIFRQAPEYEATYTETKREWSWRRMWWVKTTVFHNKDLAWSYLFMGRCLVSVMDFAGLNPSARAMLLMRLRSTDVRQQPEYRVGSIASLPAGPRTHSAAPRGGGLRFEFSSKNYGDVPRKQKGEN